MSTAFLSLGRSYSSCLVRVRTACFNDEMSSGISYLSGLFSAFFFTTRASSRMVTEMLWMVVVAALSLLTSFFKKTWSISEMASSLSGSVSFLEKTSRRVSTCSDSPWTFFESLAIYLIRSSNSSLREDSISSANFVVSV